MSTSAVPAVVNYLVGVFRAANTIGAAPSPVPVYDGPTAMEPGQSNTALYVGVDDPGIDTPSSSPTGALSIWEWGQLGARSRWELITIPLTALAIDAGGDVQAARTACSGLYAAVDALIVPGDLTLGGLALYITGMGGATLKQGQYTSGAVAWWTFPIECKVRI